MIPVQYISREILERVFLYSTTLDDLFDSKRGSAYRNGNFIPEVDRRRIEVGKNIRTRKAITQVCRGWRSPALKFRFEFLTVDAKCEDSWRHVKETLEKLAVGRYVKRLQLDAFDSSIIRLKSAFGILKQCYNAKYVSLTFPDDTRRNIQGHEFLLSAMQYVDSSSLEYFHCNFGYSFEQASIISSISKFSYLRTISIDSAFGFGSTSLFEVEPLELSHLRSIRTATTKDVLFRCMSEWILPVFEDLSIFHLKSARTTKQFFRSHGSKIRTLDLTFIDKDSDISDLNECCPNLEELVISVDGIPYTFEDGVSCRLQHDRVKFIGIRDVSINASTVYKTMAVLNGFMRMFTLDCRFPKARDIRLLDFQRELWDNVSWTEIYVEIWMIWIERCDNRKMELQASDGKALSFATGKLSIKEDAQDDWLSLRTR